MLFIPFTALIYGVIFTEDMGFSTSLTPSSGSVFKALFIGLIIPVVSSIVPIRRALSQNLTEALRPVRNKTSGVQITFTNNKKANILPYLVFGSISVAFGASIYYFLPLALLSLDLNLILYIFFAILLGMLTGLCLMALNVISALQ